MKKIIQKNQVILTALAIMIAVAGYLNYTNEDSASTVSKESTDKKDDSVMYEISDEDILNENEIAKTAKQNKKDENTTKKDDEDTKDGEEKKDDESKEDDVAKIDDGSNDKTDEKDVLTSKNVGEAILVNNTISLDAIYTAKLNREQERAKNKEMLLSVVDDNNASEKMKDEALNKILQITTIAEKELAAETLLAAKGYDNTVVSISDESTDVIVDVPTITSEDATVIMDAVMRKTGTVSSKIVITPVTTKEAEGSID